MPLSQPARLARTGAILALCAGLGWSLTRQPPPPESAAAVPAPAVSSAAPKATAPKATPPAKAPMATAPAKAAPGASAAQGRDRITGTDPVTLAFAGDANFEDQLRPVGADPDGLAALKPYLSKADVTVVNLETAVTERGKPQAGKQFTFRTPASTLVSLANAGVDVVGMANNHAVDFGATGLADTLAARAGAPLQVIGIGADEVEAFAPAVTTVDGVSIAIINATQLREHTTVYYAAGPAKAGVASAVTLDRLTAAVRAAADRFDVVAVFLHWGVEKEFCPSPAQFAATKALTAAGADAIVGGHAHRVQGAGWTGDTYVAYGLGNFIWYKDDTFPGRSTGVLTLSIDKGRVAARRSLPPERRREPGAMVTAEQWIPLENNATGVPAAVDAATADQMLRDRAGRQQCARLTGTP